MEIRGYKVFNSDWTCRGFKYEVGKSYETDEKPSPCERGFHFCKRLIDCFDYYRFNPINKVAKIIAYGEIETKGNKSCTNKIHIAKELSWHEVLDKVNLGVSCTGMGNVGDYNTGDCNLGYYNSGHDNSGNDNTGHCNSGNHNTGHQNSGSYNVGHQNSGSYNVGHCNSGNWNSGHFNKGNWNSGLFNSTDFSTGCFNTKKRIIYMFNKPSDWTIEDFINSDAYRILNRMPTKKLKWVTTKEMTKKEKEDNPTYEVTGGFLKEIEADVQGWWDDLTKEEKEEIMSLPKFDAEIFKECTGISVCKG